jgi:hypothetical protein
MHLSGQGLPVRARLTDAGERLIEGSKLWLFTAAHDDLAAGHPT